MLRVVGCNRIFLLHLPLFSVTSRSTKQMTLQGIANRIGTSLEPLSLDSYSCVCLIRVPRPQVISRAHPVLHSVRMLPFRRVEYTGAMILTCALL